MNMNDKLLSRLTQDAKKYYNLELTENDLKVILRYTEFKNYNAGDILCEVGDKLNKVGFITDGLIRSSFITCEGKDITRFFHTKYSMVMDDCLLGFEESKYRCEVIKNTSLILFECNDIKHAIKEYPLWKEWYILSLESGMRYKLYHENELMTKNATERYIQFIKDFPDVAANAKQCDIATYLGIEPQSLSRIRRSLKNHHPNQTDKI